MDTPPAKPKNLPIKHLQTMTILQGTKQHEWADFHVHNTMHIHANHMEFAYFKLPTQ